jgi:hypothetical protein
MAKKDFPVLLAPSDNMLSLHVFDRKYIMEYPSRVLWLSEADGSLFEGMAGSGVFFGGT